MAVYLLHFHKPISPSSTCQHYLGWAKQLDARIEFHRKGRSGVRLLEVAFERGIGFDVARVWPEGDKSLERRLKNWHKSWQLCPICKEERQRAREQSIREVRSYLGGA